MRQNVVQHTCKLKTGFSSERGASLAESLIAVAIVAIAITAFLAALSTGSMAVQRSDERVTAENLARAQMEDIKGQGYAAAGSYNKIDEPDGYSISVGASAIGGRDINEIQRVTVTLSYARGNVTVEAFKVNR